MMPPESARRRDFDLFSTRKGDIPSGSLLPQSFRAALQKSRSFDERKHVGWPRWDGHELAQLVLQRLRRDTEVAASEDRNWNEYFSVVLIPNPALSSEQQVVIAQDYCMEYGQTAIAVRKALLYYFNKRLRLDVAKAIDDPKETPVVVLNERAFQDVLAEVG